MQRTCVFALALLAVILVQQRLLSRWSAEWADGGFTRSCRLVACRFRWTRKDRCERGSSRNDP